MENNSERLHYAIALGLGVVGLLIILIFVSIRSQADVTTSSVNITNSSPTITAKTAYGNAAESLDSSFTLAPETNVVSNSVSTTFYTKFTYTDPNGCTQVSNNTDSYGFYMYKNGTGDSCSPTSSASMTCINAAHANYTCAVVGCDAGGGDTDALVSCSVTVPYNTAANDTWYMTDYVYDGVMAAAGTNNATSLQSITMDPTNAIKITSGSGNTAKTTIDFGTVAVGATSSIDTVAIYNVGNSTGTLTFDGTQMDCSASNSTPIATTSIKYSTTGTAAAVYAGTALTDSAVSVVSTMGVLPTFSLAGTSVVSSTYFGLNLTSAQGAAGTCTGVVNIIKGS